MSVNTDLNDRIIDNAAMSRLFEEGLQRDLSTIYDNHRSRMHTLVSRGLPTADLDRQIRSEIQRVTNEAFRMLSPQLRGYISMQADFHTDNLDKSLGEIWRTRNAPKVPLRDLVGTEPLRDSRVLANHFKDIGTGERTRVSSLLRRARSQGLDANQTADLLLDSGALKVTRVQARAVTRTAITQYGTSAAFAVYAENADILEGYTYVATLDTRTTPICSRHDGKSYKFGAEYQPKPPLHFNCRSTTVPWVKDYYDINRKAPQVKRNNYDNLPPRTRASIDGQVPVAENYGAWLTRQSYSVKVRHLGGTARADLFTDGDLRLIQFTNSSGKFLSLTSLQRLNNTATERRTRQQGIQHLVCRSPCKDYNEKDDFRLKGEDSEITDFSDFHGPNGTANIFVLVDRFIFEEQRGGLALSAFRGESQERRNYFQGLLYTDPENLRLDPTTGTLRHTSYQNIDGSDVILERRREAIRNSKDLTDADKDLILNRLDGLYAENLTVINHINALDITFRIARISRQKGKDFFTTKGNSLEDYFQRNLYGEKGPVNTTARDLDTFASGAEKTRVALSQTAVEIVGRGAVKIDDIIKLAPAAQVRVDTFRFDRAVAADVLSDLQADPSNAILFKTATRSDIARAIERGIQVADGSNDWTLISQAIGKELWSLSGSRAFPDIPGHKGSGIQWYQTGDSILKSLRASGMIERRSIMGRVKQVMDTAEGPGGKWVDRRMFYIEWRSPQLLEHLTDRSLIKERRNLGYRDKTSPWVVEEGSDVFKGTNVEVHTSGIRGEHAELDSELAKSLENDLAIAQIIDPDGFAVFLLKDADTRRPGKVLSLWQQALRDRNDYKALATLRYRYNLQLESEDFIPWTSFVRIHQSGRSQNLGNLTPHEGGAWRPAFSNEREAPLGATGFERIKERLAVLVDKELYNDEASRIRWVDMNSVEILELGRLVNNVIRGQRFKGDLAKVDNNSLLAMISLKVDDVDELNSFKQLALEYYRIQQVSSRGGRFAQRDKIEGFPSRILPEGDASESGQANIGIALKDTDTLEKTGVISQGQNLRLRNQLADAVLDDPYIKQNFPFLTKKALIKVLKGDITTSAYGAEESARALRLIFGTEKGIGSDGLYSFIREVTKNDDDYVVYTKTTVKGIMRMLRFKLKELRRSDKAADIADRMILQQISEQIDYDWINRVATSEDLILLARHIDPDTQDVLRKVFDGNSTVISHTNLSRLSSITEGKLKTLLPKLEDYFDFVGDMFESYALRPGQEILDGIIPVSAWDGARKHFKYSSKQKIEFEDIDENGNTVFIQLVTEQPATVDIARVRSTGPIELNFFQDSGFPRVIAGPNGRWHVYDGFGALLGEFDDLIEAGIQAAGQAVDANNLRNQLSLLRRPRNGIPGLPDADYVIAGKTYPGYNTLDKFLKRIQGQAKGTDITEQEIRSYLLD